MSMLNLHKSLESISNSDREWICIEADVPAAISLSQHIQVSPLIAHLIQSRGYKTPQEAQRFLDASLKDMPDPDLLDDCDRAAARLLDAIASHEQITIYGDYDVDGVTSSALLWRFFKDLFNIEVQTYIPKRLVEGYGLNCSATREIHQRGAEVLITVDNGSSAIEEVKLAQDLGMDVIIVDHHQVSDPEPVAFAHLNPHRRSSVYPDSYLAAVGVAFMLLIQIRKRIRTDDRFKDLKEHTLRQYLDIVALGTVADVAQLKGINRAMVKGGLREIQHHVRPGVQALAEVSKSRTDHLTAGDIGFKLGPRINAAGRLDDARYGLELLISDDQNKVKELADQVECYNQERKKIQDKILKEAIEQAEMLPSEAAAVVVADPSWHHGVVGIVAARLVERYHRPALVLGGEGDDLFKGSARSVSKVNIKEALDACSELLPSYGGHVAAAGLSVKRADLELFKERLWAHLTAEGHTPKGATPLKADAEVSLHDISATFMNDFERLAPFGHGNPTPRFITRGLRGRGSTLSDGKHLKIHFNLPPHLPQEAIGWNMGPLAHLCEERVDLYFIPEWNEFRGIRKIVLKLKGICKHIEVNDQ